MANQALRKGATSVVVRAGQQEPEDRDWLARSPAERIGAVWELTLVCHAWTSSDPREPRSRDLLAEFNAHGVEYLVVGAHALAAYGHVRATKDLDVWVRPSSDNASRVLLALKSFGAPLHDLTAHDLSSRGLIFQIGVDPVRIDVITEIIGVAFAEAWPDRFAGHFGDQEIPVISRKHLIQNKKATGRTQDIADVERLEKLGEPG